jgi:hypothetical protein
MMWWRWADDWSERKNWGLVTSADNAYDGRETTIQAHPCSSPLQNFECGHEQRDYGDAISRIRAANWLWYRIDQPSKRGKSARLRH